MIRRRLVLTCEHAGNRIPARYRHLFDARRAQAALHSHRGYDPGALLLARRLSERFRTELHYNTVTRLLVEPNRTIGHKAVFSEFSAPLPDSERQRVIDLYYTSHRNRVTAAIDRLIEEGSTVVHVAVHSFTPRLHGETRRADIALLYDPRRPAERQFCTEWVDAMRRRMPDLRYRKNYPYRGRDDGFTSWLRRRHPDPRYLGIELEVNQKLLGGTERLVARIAAAVESCLRDLLET